MKLLKLFTRIRDSWYWRKTIRECWPTLAAFSEDLTRERRAAYMAGFSDGRSSVLLELKKKYEAEIQKAVN